MAQHIHDTTNNIHNSALQMHFTSAWQNEINEHLSRNLGENFNF